MARDNKYHPQRKEKRGEQMKKTITVEKGDNKIIVTYFNGEYSEWFLQSKLEVADDELKATDKLFPFLVEYLDNQIRKSMMAIGEMVQEQGIGKHLFKYDKS